MNWIDACSADALDCEEALRFDHGNRTFAIFRDQSGAFFCTDGLCTHEDVHLADGLVVENTVECPKHASIFNFETGAVDTPPACKDLRTYKVKTEDGRIWIEV